MKIQIAVDTEEAQEFLQYLKSQGHAASIGSETGDYIDGVLTSTDEDANETMRKLWSDYCNQ